MTQDLGSATPVERATPLSSKTRDEELKALIAEQEADDTYRVWSRELSIDQPVSDATDSATWHDFLGDEDEQLLDLVGGNETWVEMVPVSKRDVTDEDVKFWRYLKERQGWTAKDIAEHVGRSYTTVKKYLPRYSYRRTQNQLALNKQFQLAKSSYEAGDRLIDVAAALYEQAGYKTPESCYQALRSLFLRRKVVIRPQSWKHGRRSNAASRETYIAYWKEQNRKARDRHRATLRRCAGETRAGNQCSRWAVQDLAFCNIHAGLVKPRHWTVDRVCTALIAWTEEHGRRPRPVDWKYAAPNHPNFKTVYGLFSTWDLALDTALGTVTVTGSYRRAA